MAAFVGKRVGCPVSKKLATRFIVLGLAASVSARSPSARAAVAAAELPVAAEAEAATDGAAEAAVMAGAVPRISVARITFPRRMCRIGAAATITRTPRITATPIPPGFTRTAI